MISREVELNRRGHNPWMWIPSLCVAEEIPSAVVTYVALVMFLQFGASESLASLYSALLFLPWMIKSFLYTKARRVESVRWRIFTVELCMLLILMLTAIVLSNGVVRHWQLFALMLVLSLLCAWHELFSRLYYSRMLHPRQQRVFRATKAASSFASLVLTYGLLIILAGFFEVFFRGYKKAWAMESSIVAGGFLVVVIVNALVFKSSHKSVSISRANASSNKEEAMKTIDKLTSLPHSGRLLASLFFLLLPQALIFNTRVFFLLSPESDGGLGCSLQDVGYAQGSVGVLAFAVGMTLGRYLMRLRGYVALHVLASGIILLSPVAYTLMALWPQPDNLFLICCTTFFAQFCFGFGLNACNAYVRYFSRNRYSNTTNILYIPVVASMMLLPMSVSGWLCVLMGYQMYFSLCSLSIPIVWMIVWLCNPNAVLFHPSAIKCCLIERS